MRRMLVDNPHRTGVARAFGYAWTGLAEAALRERNLRVQLALGVLACAFAAVAPLAPVERALLLACAATVIGAEAVNSAVEAVVDLASPGRHEKARQAKDAAAGAVLALAAGSLLALTAIAGPLARSLWARAPELAPSLGGALGTALAAGFLPAGWSRRVGVDWLLVAGGAAGLVPLARAAETPAGPIGAGLLLALAADAARRRRRGA
jgi:diacylglycerol kinase (ATP)